MDKQFALMVEGDRDLATLIRHVLEPAGFRTEVVERLSTGQPDFVLIDLDLPGISGNQLLELIRKVKRLQRSKVNEVTSYSQIAESLSVEPIMGRNCFRNL